MLLLLLATGLGPAALAETPAAIDASTTDLSAPDPKASPITVAITDPSPGPFTCVVDPYVVVRQGEVVAVEIRLQVPAGKKLYRDQVAVVVGSFGGLVAGTLVLPAGVMHTDAWGGEPREVFDKDTVIVQPLNAPVGLSGRVDVSLEVQWQGCSDQMCFMPGGQSFNLPVRVKAAK
jgi:thiol:disulfide interchange protein